MNQYKEKFMNRAIELAQFSIENNFGGPFGAVIVKDGVIIGEGFNRVTTNNDPTAHAEVVAIRDACKNMGSFQLEGCEIYSSCEPCPMCLGAIYWARLSVLYFSASKDEASDAGFDDSFIYNEIALPYSERKIQSIQIHSEHTKSVFEKWKKMSDKTMY
jgi:guanine deaminase